MRSRHRISKLLLRQGIVYSGGQAWTGTHELWLARQHFDAPARQLTYESPLEAMHEISDRRDRLDQAIAAMAYGSEYTPVVRALHGHCHTQATIAVARKLAERTWKTLSTGQMYELRDLQGQPVTQRAAKELIASRYTVTPKQRTQSRSHTAEAKRARLTR